MSNESGEIDGEAPVIARVVEDSLADPHFWDEPSVGLEDGIVAAIESEAAPFEPLGGAPAPESGRGRWRAGFLGAAAALVLLFAAVVVISALDDTGDDETIAVDLAPTGLVADATGSVELTSTDSGIRIELVDVALPRRDGGAFYEGWVATVDGDRVPVGTFHDGESVVLWAGVGLDSVQAFTITQEGVSSVDASGQDSSGDVVLKADMPGG